VTRAGAGEGGQDTETYQPTGGSADEVVYDGLADVQDAGEAVPRTATGQPTKEADATAFLPKSQREALLSIAVDDAVRVFYPNSDRIADGEVRSTREFDLTVMVRYR
jgi:hypothetical protein